MDFMGALKGIGSGFKKTMQNEGVQNYLASQANSMGGEGGGMFGQIMSGMGRGAAQGKAARERKAKKEGGGMPPAAVPGGPPPIPGNPTPEAPLNPDAIGLSPFAPPPPLVPDEMTDMGGLGSDSMGSAGGGMDMMSRGFDPQWLRGGYRGF